MNPSNNIIPLSITAAIIATFCSALIIFAERAFPFILFSRKKPPKVILFIEKYIPPMVMAALVVYCLKDVHFTSGIAGLCTAGWIPYLGACSITIIFHLWKSNSLLSILGGTASYMLLIHIPDLIKLIQN